MADARPSLTPDPYRTLCDALDAGIAYGLRRADKHAREAEALTDAQRDRLTTALYDAILNECCERFTFGDEGE